jgi:hypothetical protein
MSAKRTRVEEFEVSGEELLGKMKELVHQGNIRRVAVRNEEGRTLIDLPLTVGVVGALLAPQLVAVGALAAILSHGTIVVERAEPPAPEPEAEAEA